MPIPLKRAFTAGLRGIDFKICKKNFFFQVCLLHLRGAPPSSAGLWLCYMPMQLVAPRAVTIAVAIDAIICTMNLIVSLFVKVI